MYVSILLLGINGCFVAQPKMFWPDTIPLPKSSVVFSELNQYCINIGTVSDQYAHICIRPV